MITNPILAEEPIKPKILKLALSNMIFALVTSIFFVFILDRIRGKVYEFDNLGRIFNSNSIINLSFKNKYEFNETIELISKTKFSDLKDSLCILHIGEIPSFVLKSLKSNFEKNLSDVGITLTKEVGELINLIM